MPWHEGLTHPSTRTLRDEPAQRRLCQTLEFSGFSWLVTQRRKQHPQHVCALPAIYLLQAASIGHIAERSFVFKRSAASSKATYGAVCASIARPQKRLWCAKVLRYIGAVKG